MADLTYDTESLDAFEMDDESWEELVENLDDESAEFIGAFLPPPFQFLDPVGAAIGAATGAGRRRPGQRPPATGTGAGYYRRPLPQAFVTQAQLRQSLATVQRDVKKNAAAIKTVNARVTSNGSRLDQQNRINVRQGRQIKEVKQQLDQQSQMQLLTSLLARTEEVRVLSSSDASIVAGTTLRFEKDLDPLMFLLPMMTGGSGAGSGGLGNPLLLMALMAR